jgi:hypothetical protein
VKCDDYLINAMDEYARDCREKNKGFCCISIEQLEALIDAARQLDAIKDDHHDCD